MPILCGTDLSAASVAALDVACALAAMRGEPEVILLHVANISDDDASRDAQLADLRVRLDTQGAAAGTARGVRVRTELVVGKPEERLASFADTESVSLLVIAHASRTGSTKVGTTATTVISHATVPVLCIADSAPWIAFAEKKRPLRLLLGIDDSATCDLSIQFTQALRAEGPLDIVLGAVYYPDDASKHYGIRADSLVDRVPEIETLMARDLVRRFDGDQSNVVARPVRGIGRIGDHLLELARSEKVDAVVVGTSQKTGFGRLGSVSTVVVQEGTQSVICIPPSASVPTVTVPTLRASLVATDFSQFANRAVAYAFSITPPDGTVHIVHVIDEDKTKVPAEKIADLERQLRALAPRAAQGKSPHHDGPAPTQHVIAHVLFGDDAAEALAQSAVRHGVDVICISSRGRSGITRALVGSVADRLLRATRLPVLVLRPS